MDPQSVFSFAGDYIVTCRGNENDFTIYGFQSLDFVLTVGFHKVLSLPANLLLDCCKRGPP